MVARYWLESLAGVSCNIEIASELRYRKSHVPKNALIVTISQSGETADTLAALRLAKEIGYRASLVICNVAGSSLVRESDLAFMTKADSKNGCGNTDPTIWFSVEFKYPFLHAISRRCVC